MRRCLLLAVILFVACSKRAEQPSVPANAFTEIAAETGLRFRHFTGATGQYYMPEIMGSGAALFDYDSDGDLDVYLVQGALLEPGKTDRDVLFPLPDGQPRGNWLFRNEIIPSGKLSFTDVTEEAGAGSSGYGMGVAVGDYDNDGHPDLYLTNVGPNVLLRNEGNGTFKDVTQKGVTDDPRWSTGASFVDYDRDGDLDLFVANYVDFTVRGNKRCYGAAGAVDYCTPRAYDFVTDRLLRNDGNGRFTDVSLSSRAGTVKGPGLGVAAIDVNQDGWQDIVVANDSAANFVWVNQRDGTFREQGLEIGLAYAEDGIAKAGMGITAGDFDNDGDEDIFVVNLMSEGATLFRSEGGHFSDASLGLGVGAATFRGTGFGTGWFDFDNDGWMDLFIANGAVTIVEEQRGSPYPFEQQAVLLRNPGGGKRFETVPAFPHSEVGRGAAFGDIDNDGDIDILVSNNNGPVRLFRNEVGSRRNWFAARLVAKESNRMALGSRVRILRTGVPPLWRRAHTDSSYLSASDVRVHFGLGDTPAIEQVEVHWPCGAVETWDNVPANRLVTLVEGSGRRMR